MPKIQPRIGEFLARTNAAERFGIAPFAGSVDDLPIRTWRYLKKANQIMIEIERERQKAMETNLANK